MSTAPVKELGYTRQVTADAGLFTLELLVQPKQDLGQRFKAWASSCGVVRKYSTWGAFVASSPFNADYVLVPEVSA